MIELSESQKLRAVWCVRKAVAARLDQWDAQRDLERVFENEDSGSIPELDVEELITNLAAGLGSPAEAMVIPTSVILPEIERRVLEVFSGI